MRCYKACKNEVELVQFDLLLLVYLAKIWDAGVLF